MTQIAISTPRPVRKKALGARVLSLLSLARQRRALARLDDRALHDIGITRSEAQSEAKRPVWDAPENWHKHLY